MLNSINQFTYKLITVSVKLPNWNSKKENLLIDLIMTSNIPDSETC